MGGRILLLQVANWIVNLEGLFIIVRILLTWIRPQRYSRWFWQLEEVLYRLTEPVLGPIRSRLPTTGFGLDFSPIIALVGLQLLLQLFAQILLRL